MVEILKSQRPINRIVCTDNIADFLRISASFISYLFRSIRGDGIKEVMAQPGEDFRFPTNIADAFKGVDGQDSLVASMLWDLSFQVCFLYILLSIITGIIIDGFGGLREEREASEEDLRTVCFVCSLDKARLDLEGIGFHNHIKDAHSPPAYFCFLLFLRYKKKAELSNQERYVKDRVWPPSGMFGCLFGCLGTLAAVS